MAVITIVPIIAGDANEELDFTILFEPASNAVLDQLIERNSV